MLAMRRQPTEDVPAVAVIVSGLPDHFTGDVPAKVTRDATHHHAGLADSDELVASPQPKGRRRRGEDPLEAIYSTRRG